MTDLEIDFKYCQFHLKSYFNLGILADKIFPSWAFFFSATRKCDFAIQKSTQKQQFASIARKFSS